MDNSKKQEYRKDVYNSIPVYYCTQCLSLKVKSVQGVQNMDFCDECNSTNIDVTDIFEWERLYEERYGHRYLDKPKY